MIFNNAENKCILSVLDILDKKESRYSSLFRETKVSHTTLQKVLKDLERKKFISRGEIYQITEKGRKLLRKLEELKNIMI